MSVGQKQFNAATQSFGSAAPSFNSPMSSQTPYGPHVPTVASATTNSNAPNPAAREVPQEDISTIFVVGFPDDMQVRHVLSSVTKHLRLDTIYYRNANFKTCLPSLLASRLLH
jgi:hypothetical protein